MDLNKAKYHLKRIDTILNLHPDGLTPLDRDIILEDIRRLYDVFTEWPKHQNTTSQNQPSTQTSIHGSNHESHSATKPPTSQANHIPHRQPSKIYTSPAVEMANQTTPPSSPQYNTVQPKPSQSESKPVPPKVEAPVDHVPAAYSTETPPSYDTPETYTAAQNTPPQPQSIPQQEEKEEIKPAQPISQQPIAPQPRPQYTYPSQPTSAQPTTEHPEQPSPIQYQKIEPQVVHSNPEVSPKPAIEPQPNTQYSTTPQHVTQPQQKVQPQPSATVQDRQYHESVPSQNTNTTIDNVQFSELFDVQADHDLSGRLGNAKIENLNSVLGINDKILYINQLFGGEAIPFQEALKKFQSFYTYAEAKEFAISELVETYNWSKPDKKGIVNNFMKQVRRLY